jgi:hypothetical protein
MSNDPKMLSFPTSGYSQQANNALTGTLTTSSTGTGSIGWIGSSGIGGTTLQSGFNMIYPSSYPPISYPVVDKYGLKVERVENGWVLEKNGKKFVILKAEEILEYLKEDIK